jgi:hypothetical protein
MRFDIDPTAGTLAGDGSPRAIPAVAAEPGLLVEVASNAFVGAVVSCTAREVTLRDRRGRERRFSLSPGAFFVDERQVSLVPPASQHAPTPASEPAVTRSGSIAVPAAPARTARASRILVEGLHDAELLELVWGDDLRVEGIVVEPLHGADDLAAVVRAFGPAPHRRLGVLLDHLRPGTKEHRIARDAAHPHVLITGHPFVDVWAAIRPSILGIEAWPDIPKGEHWKTGVARRLGVADHRELWPRLRAGIRDWRDLDQELIRSVERLLDFVTHPDATPS